MSQLEAGTGVTMAAAVLFDMDGVIVDTEPLKFQAYREVFFRRYHIRIEDYRERLGLSETAVMQFYLQAHNLKDDICELVGQKRERYLAILADTALVSTPGLRALLAALKERPVRLGLATSSDRQSSDSILTRLSLKAAFDAIVTRDDVQRQKPEPEIYLQAAARLEARPEHCIVIEDSPAGITAGKKAGMTVVGLTSGVPETQLLAAGADLVISDFAEDSRQKIVALANLHFN